MSEDVYAQRYDAHISLKDINKLADEEESAIERIKSFYAEHPTSNLYIKEYPPKSVTCNDIRVYLENLKNNGHHFDAVIIDYLNLVKSQTKIDNMFMDGLDVSEKLRAISYEMKCPVISAVQTNSEGMNNENVGMENISQSRGIAFTTDFLMALFQTDDDRENGIIQARLLKNRLGGQVGKVLHFKLGAGNLTLADVSYTPEAQTAFADVSIDSMMDSASGMISDMKNSDTSNTSLTDL
jgi:replicative DNA helicase